MKLKTIIDQIKASASGTFGTRVAGAAEFEEAVETDDLAVPAAFVFPLSEAVGPNETVDKVVQTVEEQFAVIVAVSNVADRRGQAAAEALDNARTALWTALLGFEPAGLGPVEYRGGQFLAMNRGRLWWQYEFATLNVIANY